jgi:hypothetical protein
MPGVFGQRKDLNRFKCVSEAIELLLPSLKTNWNDLERLCDLHYVTLESNKNERAIQVKNENYRYLIYDGNQIPSFVYIPKH